MIKPQRGLVMCEKQSPVLPETPIKGNKTERVWKQETATPKSDGSGVEDDLKTAGKAESESTIPCGGKGPWV